MSCLIIDKAINIRSYLAILAFGIGSLMLIYAGFATVGVELPELINSVIDKLNL